jgi:hypothetical protein
MCHARAYQFLLLQFQLTLKVSVGLIHVSELDLQDLCRCSHLQQPHATHIKSAAERCPNMRVERRRESRWLKKFDT